MSLNCGIVGLPNVGKSTLFNLLNQSILSESQNYPFCTIEPHRSVVAVPDPRLEIVAQYAQSKEIIPATLEIVDIAGLVKGAHKGEGLGNQFLDHIRSVDAIIHMVRCFDDPNVIHVEGSVDPIRDIEIIRTELMLADIESVERRIQKKGADKASLQACLDALNEGNIDKIAQTGVEDLLCTKPTLYIANVSEGQWKDPIIQTIRDYVKAEVIPLCASVEAEVLGLPPEDRMPYLQEIGLEQSGLQRVIQGGYALLDLITYFTAGPKETHAWTIHRGTKAPQAAAKIHTDFERGFIRVEVMAYEDFAQHKGAAGVKAAGRLRVEGRDYVVQDGDLLLFRFNV